MRGAQLAGLGAVPPGVTEALDLVAGFDDALAHGFGRLGEERAGRLALLAGAVSGSPIADAVGDAVAKVGAGSVSDDHLTTLAAARAAVLGAVHDALLAGADTATGRTRPPWDTAPAAADPVSPNLLAGCRSWLTEVAVTGWRGITHDLVAAAAPLVEALLAEPALRRPAVLLDGLSEELRAASPVATMPRLPERRWGDLWSRAMLLARSGPWAEGEPETVSGRLLPLGVDVHEHATAVQAQVHAVLEPSGGGPARLVRASLSASKVDTVVGPTVWQLLGGHPVLLGALAGKRALDVTDLPLLPGGDLLWHDDRAVASGAADPFITARVALPDAHAPAVAPLDRHPVRIAEPVFLDGIVATAADGRVTFAVDGETISVDLDRLPSCGPLTVETVAGATSCVGLLRWDDGRWSVQPLAVAATVRRKPVVAHTGDWALGPTDPRVVKAEAKVGDPVAVLRERAGRLLRK